MDPTASSQPRGFNHDGLLYHFKEQSKSTVRWRCSHYRNNGCSAKIIQNKVSGVVELQGEHMCSQGMLQSKCADRFSKLKESPNIQEQDSIVSASIFTQGKVSQSAHLTGNDSSFQIPKKTKQKEELEEKILFLKSKANEHVQGANEHLSQTYSFSTNYVTDWEKLSRTCSSMSQMSEAAKLLFEEKNKQLSEKDKTILELKVTQTKLEDILEMKENNLLQLRETISTLQGDIGQLQGENGKLQGELSGLNVIKSLLKEKEDEIRKLNAELIQVNKGSPINPHRQCEETILLLKTQVDLLTIERDKYRDHRDDLAGIVSKKVMDVMEQHINDVNISEASFQSNNELSQDDCDNIKMEDSSNEIPAIVINCKLNSNNQDDKLTSQKEQKLSQQVDKTFLEDLLNVNTTINTICKWCDTSVIGSPLRWKNDNIKPVGALVDHINGCPKFLEYQNRVSKLAVEWKQHLQEQDALLQSKLEFGLTSQDDIVKTLRLSKTLQLNKIDLQEFLDEQEGDQSNRVSFLEIDTANVALTDLFDSYIELYPLESYYHKSEGYMQWNTTGELIDVTTATQQNNLAEIKMDTFRYRCLSCTKVFACEAGWKEHAYYSFLNSNKNCRCDVFEKGKYSHSVDYVNPIKRQRQFKGKEELEALEELILTTIYIKSPNIEPEPKRQKTALEERRVTQQHTNRRRFKDNRQYLATVEKWLLEVKKFSSTTFSSATGKLTKLGDPICDAIILPTCILLFGNGKQHNSNMEAFLKEYLPVQGVFKSQRKKDKCVLVQLTDARNIFTLDLLAMLKTAVFALINKTISKAKELQHTKQWIQQEVDNIYVRQIDYTQDLSGFFASFDIKRDLDTLSKELGISYSTEYTQTQTLFHFTEADEGNMLQRIKIYNKLVHLLTCGQFKKSLSMNIRKLLKPSLEFYINKMKPSMELGLTRIEQSVYFNSLKDWQSLSDDLSMFEAQINDTLRALNKIKERVVYHVNFKDFWQSFWHVIDEHTVFISFEPDAWAVCYAFCKNSSLYSGYEVDKHNKSGSMLTFLKRFAGKRTIVFIRDKQFLITKQGEIRQIPMDSLNVMHNKEYDGYPIDSSQFDYYLSEEQLATISFTCENSEFYEIFGEKPYMSEFDQYRSDEEQQPQMNAFGQREVNHFDINDDDQSLTTLTQKKKRQVKLTEKKDGKEKRQPRERSNRQARNEQWKKKGQHKGKQRWECLKCGYRTVIPENPHQCL